MFLIKRTPEQLRESIKNKRIKDGVKARLDEEESLQVKKDLEDRSRQNEAEESIFPNGGKYKNGF